MRKKAVPRHRLEVQYVATTSLTPNPHNSRVHSAKQVRQIADSIQTFGFVAPVLVDDDNILLAGHGRHAAATLLGMNTVPVARASGLTAAQQRALMLADNKLTDLSHFDQNKLKSEFEFLIGASEEFSIETTGFDIVEVDRLLNLDGATPQGEEVALPEPDAVAVTRPGDLWMLGDHRLLCGNALARADYGRLLGAERASMIVSDPPCNVRIGGNVSGLGAKTHREFAMASGEMSQAEFTYGFLRPVFELMRDHAAPAAIAYICMDWRHLRDVENAAERIFAEQKNTICWVKSNAGLGSFYRSQHEMIPVFQVSPGKPRNNFGLGATGRHRTNVWQYPGVNTFRAGRQEDLDAHPTVKPTRLFGDAMLDCSAPGDIILDPFLGSGTTVLAAALTGRRGYGIELDPLYVDVAIGRVERASGLVARLNSGETFAEAAAARGVSLSGEPA